MWTRILLLIALFRAVPCLAETSCPASFAALGQKDPFSYAREENFRPSDRPAGGSQGGRWFQDRDGNFYFGKSYGGDTERLLVEQTTNDLYGYFGVKTPKTFLIRIQGEPYIFSPEVKGASVTAEALAKTDLRDHFVLDAWLGNWDVVGRDFDNALVDGEGAIRIDNGGSMFWKATGGRKEFGRIVNELAEMRDPSHRSGQVFGSLSDKEVAGQLRAFLARYAKDRGGVQSIVARSGLPPETQKQILNTLDSRARWLATTALPELHPSAATAADWAEELRASQGDSLYRFNVEQARKHLAGLKGGAARLTDGEAVALTEYMGGDFDVINGSLRGTIEKQFTWLPPEKRAAAMLDAYRPQIELAKSGLAKLPDFKGHVQRMGRANAGRYVVGRVFTEAGFLSSTDGGAAPYEGSVIFDILSKHGKKIAFLNPGSEEEVLFAPGTKFRILSKVKDAEGNWHIRMNEL